MPWERLLQKEIIALLIPITGILVWGAITITKLVIRHRERIARIEHGMEPDRKPDASTGQSTAMGRTSALPQG